MPRSLVVCGGLESRRHGQLPTIRLDTNPNAAPNVRIKLRLDALTERLLDNLDPVLADAVEIASYVYMADRIVSRGDEQMRRMGAEWRREFVFRVPVRKPQVWRRLEVSEALTDALAFLSDEEFRFEFEPGDPATRLDPFLGFNDHKAHRFVPDDVILFSGGLDSLAGAAEQVLRQNRNALLVTHRSSKNIAGSQEALVRALSARSHPSQVFHAPVWVEKGSYDTPEYSQRTRSFLFASLGVAVGAMFNKDVVHFFENGITSFNLPIAEHVIGTRASRTTHPRVLRDFERLFSLLLDRRITIRNPFLWHTKADVVEVLKANKLEALLVQSVSCAEVRQWAMTGKHCGACSQCIDRRFAVLASGLRCDEPPETYAIDLFKGEHTKATVITLVVQHVCRAEKLAQMTLETFLARYGHVFRVLPYLDGDPSDNAEMIWKLHQRYGAGVIEVVNQELRANATFEATQALPRTSLLAMITAPVGSAPPFVDPIALERKVDDKSKADERPVKHRRFVFAIDACRKKIIFEDGPFLSGASFVLFNRLAGQFRIDQKSGTKPHEHASVDRCAIIKDLKIDDHTLTQRVRRTRRSLSQQFAASIDYMIDDDDVIETGRSKGYRLNPYLVMVDLAQLGRVS